ncbi:MAG: glutathionylspermidine synthase family protein [Symploca sp. SIO2B6]|nr:glutathionylspermidine synthase family protein [Symploca sp. SIO2B6]
MERIIIEPRANWQQKCEEVGFHFYNDEHKQKYWNEEACYRFTTEEIEELETVTELLHELCLQAVEFVIQENRFQQLCIPPDFAELCRKSWERDDPTLYGRFDLVYDGKHPPKLLEYNADTPTALLEASVVQWTWLEEIFPGADQFNSIHEQLLTAFREMNLPKWQTLYFSCADDSQEDLDTVEYLRDLAIQAGLKTQHILIEDIGWNHTQQVFCDLNEQTMGSLFKLYPWEWLIREPFGKYLLTEPMTLLEPAWKLILSNKAILPVLWELFPNHPNLLPSYYKPEKLFYPYLSKPVFSREGANITIHYEKEQYQTPGMYGEEPLIYQSYYRLPKFDGYYPIIGSWIIGHQAAGIGIREDKTAITQDTSLFVPHYF